MSKYFLNRFISMIFVLLAAIILVFTLMEFSPGDPVRLMMGEGATEMELAALREKRGLERSYFERLGSFIWGMVHGNLGESYRSSIPVFDEIISRYPITLKLTFGSVLLGIIIGVPVGIISATKQYSIFDRIFTGISLFGVSAPSFWIAMLLVLIFSVKLGWFPPTGTYSFEYWVLPVATMGLQTSASIMRMTRSSILEVVRQDYIRTARAKGQSEQKIIWKHILPNALIPILTTIGINICSFLGGSVLVETVFAMPGIGKYILDCVNFKDYPCVLGGIVWISLNCVVVTFIIDMLYAVVDPRIKSAYVSKKTQVSKPTQAESGERSQNA
jgi:peptide/nickel transport system permease protein